MAKLKKRNVSTSMSAGRTTVTEAPFGSGICAPEAESTEKPVGFSVPSCARTGESVGMTRGVEMSVSRGTRSAPIRGENDSFIRRAVPTASNCR